MAEPQNILYIAKQFEYRVIDVLEHCASSRYRDVVQGTLNHMGTEGWELINIVNTLFYFKRELPSLDLMHKD